MFVYWGSDICLLEVTTDVCWYLLHLSIGGSNPIGALNFPIGGGDIGPLEAPTLLYCRLWSANLCPLEVATFDHWKLHQLSNGSPNLRALEL